MKGAAMAAPAIKLPGAVNSGLRSLVGRDHLRSRKYEGQQWLARREGAHEDIRAFEKSFIRRMEGLNIPMYAHNMVRTPAEQADLKRLGVSKNGSSCSPHVVGCAVDLVHGERHWQLTDAEWLLIGHIGKEVAASLGLSLVWGGDWVSGPHDNLGWDPAHWELADWRMACINAMP